MPTTREHKSQTLNVPEGFEAVGVSLSDGTHVEVTLQHKQTIELEDAGKLSIHFASIVDPAHILISYLQELEISEADSWRAKYPEEMENLSDEGVLMRVPIIQEANAARERFGDAPFDGMNTDQIIIKRDELVKTEADAEVARQVAAVEAEAKRVENDLAEKAAERQAMMNEIRQQILDEMKQ